MTVNKSENLPQESSTTYSFSISLLRISSRFGGFCEFVEKTPCWRLVRTLTELSDDDELLSLNPAAIEKEKIPVIH